MKNQHDDIVSNYDSIENSDVTVRDRDTEKQVRVKIEDLENIFKKLFSKKINFFDL